MRSRPSSRAIRDDQRNSLFEKPTPEKAGIQYGPIRVPTTSWIRMPISSCRSRSPRSARYSIGSGLKTEAYTSAIASVSAARRSRFVPVLARNRLLYLPEKAAPSRSSRRLELRTMIGPVRRGRRARPTARAGCPAEKKEFLKSWTMYG